MIVQPYAKTSKSAKALAQALGCRRIAIRRSTYRHTSGVQVINWGSQRNYPGVPQDDYINNPSSIRNASNKLRTLQLLTEAGVPTLRFTTSKNEAQEWVEEEGLRVYCRRTLTGNSGIGITVFGQTDDTSSIPDAPLYTRGLEDFKEFRLHIGSTGPETYYHILTQQKVLRDGGTSANPGDDPVRNHEAGYIFRQNNIEIPKSTQLKSVGHNALLALGLDFGAIDMAYVTDEGWKVIEVNTACGLMGSTPEKYADFLKHLTQGDAL